MTLAAGSSISHYRIVDRIGEGGMGVVWRATDSTLGRDVALKVLPSAFLSDPERLARFEREARLLASLNHPHIAGIHGLHEADGQRFLTMELVDGEDLAVRLSRGPIPLDEVLRIARQVADALETAHEKGIIHRDLKPANIQIAADGQVKVLDFGLAKALEGDGDPTSSPTLTQSPTITAAMTSANVILGTAAYMSPEQARGQRADKRSDIWALGVVMYEMLTGTRLFHGDTVSDTLAAVLRQEPDWAELPKDTPPRVRTLMKRMLERQPKLRLRDVGEARIVLDEVIAGDTGDVVIKPTAAAPNPLVTYGLPALALVLGFVAGMAMGGSGGSDDAGVQRWLLPGVPQEAAPTLTRISPDGSMTAYAVGSEVRLQPVEELESIVLTEHENLTDLFWSPDSRTLGFTSGSEVLKINVDGGTKQIVADVGKPFTGGSGATWLEDGRIIASRAEDDGMLAISSLGGDATPFLPINPADEGDFHDPEALPGNKGVLFVTHTGGGANRLEVVDLKGRRHVLLDLADQTLADPCYSPSGHVLFRRSPQNPGIWALPFSLSKLEATGPPFLVAADGTNPSVSASGTLVYTTGASSTPRQFVRADRDGKTEPIGEPDIDMWPVLSLSPDGRRIAFNRAEGGNVDVWIMDAVRGTRTRLTFDDIEESWPVWTPDGQHVVYNVRFPGGTERWMVVRRRADGTGAADTLGRGWAPSVTPDGKYVLFTSGSFTSSEINWVSAEGGEQSVAFTEAGAQMSPAVSPTGRYVAYTSFESGSRQQIYLKRFPSWEGKWQVSIDGGDWPRWNGDGTRLYYLNDDDIYEVELSGEDTPTLSRPRKLFTREPVGRMFPGAGLMFDATADGQHFVWRASIRSGDVDRSIAVVQNWYSDFKGGN